MMTVRFSDKPDEVCVFEKIDEDMIVHLFYQDDEITEFRYHALMVECGLLDEVEEEEEDWNGPEANSCL